ncbi:MAG: hypothetical protein B6247_31460 [Candidatus Parabeggiatoa sp. nov. 2]|nr:MAG: hypothetical protein B6247_31460 [Beggiatoa sp. 4572_84]
MALLIPLLIVVDGGFPSAKNEIDRLMAVIVGHIVKWLKAFQLMALLRPSRVGWVPLRKP